MIKSYLMTPGPTPVPADIMLDMALPIIHHRTSEFKTLFKETKDLTKRLFQTDNDIVIFSSSGTGAMEASVSNLLSPKDKALFVSAGKFGERWGQILNAFDIEGMELKYDYGDFAKVDDIDRILGNNSDIKALFIQASETSTGVYHPIDEIGALLKKKYPEVVFVVDGITAIGAIDVKTDVWGIDIMITGSQKALMLPPGISIMSVSDKAKNMIKNNNNRFYYFDIMKELLSDGGSYTPAVTLVKGLNGSLKRIFSEGLDNLFKRHAVLAQAAQESAKAIGLKLFAKRPANSLTSIEMPVDSTKIINLMKEFGVHVSNGQGHLKGKIIRIAHLGYFDKPDIVMAISGLEIALKKSGVDVELGSGVARAMEIFIEE